MKPMNEGIEMNHLSLKKLTLIVSTCSLASYFVSAKENELNLDLPVAEVSAAKVIVTKSASIDNLKNSTNDISEFLAKFDLDKNSFLNKAETLASKNTLLSEHFADIDQNDDEEISKEELESYLSAKTAQKTKISDLVKKS
jgi:hypothetical protein